MSIQNNLLHEYKDVLDCVIFKYIRNISELPRSDAATGDLTTQCVDITRCHVNFPKVSNLRKFRSQTDFSLYLNLTQPLLQDIFTCILLTFVPII